MKTLVVLVDKPEFGVFNLEEEHAVYKKGLLFLLFCISLIGCSTPAKKDWVAVGGSRSDATVRLSFNYNPSRYEKPEANEWQAINLAKRRCASWGYVDAEAFGESVSECVQKVPHVIHGTACGKMVVTREYQCVGRGDADIPQSALPQTNKRKNSVR